MENILIKNSDFININQIPIYNLRDFQEKMSKYIESNFRVISLFGNRKNKKELIIYCVVGNSEDSVLSVFSTEFDLDSEYPSMAEKYPFVNLFEREMYEEFGMKIINHPFLKPVRYPFNRANRNDTMENYPFYKMHGEDLHEVAVGPIHAGVIEPGHFRFFCLGETVYHLEIHLGYQHRGVEDLLNNQYMKKRKINEPLVESICGDSVISHVTAYCNAIESLSETKIPKKAKYIRAIAQELERIGIHIGDLSAIANDVAYLIGNAIFGALRTLVINTSMAICGSRFGRGLVRVGGVVYDLNNEIIENMRKTLLKVKDEVTTMAEAMFSTASVLSRLERTGVVTTEQAKEIGLVGIAARASGIEIDTRVDFPYGIYNYYNIEKSVYPKGDVYSRAYVRYLEIIKSIDYIFKLLDDFPFNDNEIIAKTNNIASNSFCVSITEGWRGETVYILITDEKGNIVKHKIKDPSFHNWYGLGLAVRNNGISDFPLCNKSFNLSYCGYDL